MMSTLEETIQARRRDLDRDRCNTEASSLSFPACPSRCFRALRARATASRRLSSRQWSRQSPQKTGKLPVFGKPLCSAVANVSNRLTGTVHLRDRSSRKGPQNVQSQSCQVPARYSSTSRIRSPSPSPSYSQAQVHAVEAAASPSAIYTGDSTALNGKHAGHFNLEEAKRLSQNGYGLCHDFVGRPLG